MANDRPEMTATAALRLYTMFEQAGIWVWIDGGWAVDALLGEQTRRHTDLDIALETRRLTRLRAVLAGGGYQEILRDDTSPWNFVLANGRGREVDVHAFTFDEHGDGVYGPAENGDFYRAEALTGRGVIDGTPVRCISARWLVRFHTGYTLSAKDFHDVQLLCERFDLELPEEYREQG